MNEPSTYGRFKVHSGNSKLRGVLAQGQTSMYGRELPRPPVPTIDRGVLVSPGSSAQALSSCPHKVSCFSQNAGESPAATASSCSASRILACAEKDKRKGFVGRIPSEASGTTRPRLRRHSRVIKNRRVRL